MVLKHTAIYTRMTTMVTAVPMMLKPPRGSNTAPSTRATTRASIDCAMVATHGVGASERAGQNIDASHSVNYTGRRVYACVGIGDSAVHDGEEDNDPSYPPVPRRHGGPGIRILDVGIHLVEAPTHHGCVGAHEVEEPDHQRRGENHPGYGSPGVARFFSEWGRCLEADEGEDGEDHTFEHPRPGAFQRVRGIEDLQGILATGCEDHVQRECQKRYYLENPERDTCVGRKPDAPVC